MTLNRSVLLIALVAALAGYFGPWLWHPAVAFRYSADDLAEFVKFMPALRSGQAPITRELFFLPLWLAAFGLALWLGRYMKRGWLRWLVGLVIVYAAIWPMPAYPFILDAYRSPEFGASFWGSGIAAVLCAAALAIGGRLADRAAALAWIVVGMAGATIAPVAFSQLKPALDALHGWAMSLGWGIGAVVIGFAVVVAAGVITLKTTETHTTHS